MAMPAPKIDYNNELNSEQLDVVMAPNGRILVLAGAGSGKTRVLTYRVAHLLSTVARPEQILLMTFTNKAAKEMMARVQDLTGINPKRIHGGTFHSIANRFLRMYGNLIGYSPSFTILDQDESFQAINAACEALNYDSKKGGFPKGVFIGALYSYARNTDKKVVDIIESEHPKLAFRSAQIMAVLEEYKKSKLKNNTMDFDDLLCNLRRLLKEHPDVRAEISRRFKHVLVDEFQDTNAVQNDLVDLLSGASDSMMCVGDDYQSIYAFRGAVFDNILKFTERYPDAHIYYLNSNYRSTPQIVSFANKSIDYNANQFKKNLVSMQGDGAAPLFVRLPHTGEQADYVADRIGELLAGGASADTIAVLYRAHFHAMELQMELTRRKIPYIVRSGPKFFDAAHIKDTVAFLRVMCNPADEVAWKRLLQLCEGIGKATAVKLIHILASAGNPLEAINSEAFKKVVPTKAKLSVSWVRTVVNTAVKEGEGKAAFLIRIFLENGYEEYLQSKYENYQNRTDDLKELLLFSAQYTKVEDFLAEVALVSNDDDQQDANKEPGGKVVLSTIHRAKGLEWSTVFLINCADGMIPLDRCLEEAAGEEEERRLFYVAVTRAKNLLIMTMPEYDPKRRGYPDLTASRFIEELEDDNTGLRRLEMGDDYP